MIKIDNITVGYGNNTVLRNISLEFKKGKFTSIIGANGCGKTTLLKSVLGVLPLSEGQIFVENCLLSNMSRKDIAKKISYLSQGRNIPNMSVEQLVLHGRFPHLNYPRRYTKLDKEIAFNAMKQMGIDDNISKNSLSTLSGGMRQNAYIAMVLAQNTDFILLDEPTTYLDIAHQFDVMKRFRTLANEGKGVVTIMHDIAMAMTFSDNIIVIHNGNIVGCGTPKDIYDLKIIEKFFGVTPKTENNRSYYIDILK